MNITDLIKQLEAARDTYGDMKVLVWHSNDPRSGSPILKPANAHLSPYYQILPDDVYGPPRTDKEKESARQVLFLTRSSW